MGSLFLAEGKLCARSRQRDDNWKLSRAESIASLNRYEIVYARECSVCFNCMFLCTVCPFSLDGCRCRRLQFLFYLHFHLLGRLFSLQSFPFFSLFILNFQDTAAHIVPNWNALQSSCVPLSIFAADVSITYIYF